MGARSVERQLRRVARRLAKVREELEVAELHRAHLGDDADDAAARALGGEAQLAARAHRAAERHEHAARAYHLRLQTEMGQLEEAQDRLLDELTSIRRSSPR